MIFFSRTFVEAVDKDGVRETARARTQLFEGADDEGVYLNSDGFGENDRVSFDGFADIVLECGVVLS